MGQVDKTYNKILMCSSLVMQKKIYNKVFSMWFQQFYRQYTICLLSAAYYFPVVPKRMVCFCFSFSDFVSQFGNLISGYIDSLVLLTSLVATQPPHTGSPHWALPVYSSQYMGGWLLWCKFPILWLFSLADWELRIVFWHHMISLCLLTQDIPPLT